MFGSRGEGNLESHPFQSSDQPVARTFRVQLIEVVVTQFPVFGAIAQNAESDQQQAMGRGGLVLHRVVHDRSVWVR